MLKLAIFIILLLVVIFALVKLIDKFVSPKMRPILSILLWATSAFLAYMIYASVMKPIEFKKEKERRYEIAVSKMMDIKKAQMGYKTVILLIN